MKKYYVEFENTLGQNQYSIQSKYFDTRDEAIQWYINNFDYVNTDEIVVSLMYAEFDNNGQLDDIYFEEDITTKFYLKGDSSGGKN